MHNHEPKKYLCPFCSIGKLKEAPYSHFKMSELVYHDKDITAFISSARWPKNEGIVIIVPNKHFENIYDTPDKLLAKIHVLAKQIAVAMKKAYHCDGVSVRQHNEPDGNQEVWHYHFQVIPRYKNDKLYVSHNLKGPAHEKERAKFAKMLKKHL